MTFGLPVVGTWPWHEDFQYYMAQSIDPTTGGINAWDVIPIVGVDGNALSSEHAGYTGINKNTSELIQWNGSAWETLVSGSGSNQAPIWTTAGRPTSPTEGVFGYNTDLDRLESYNGSAWEPLNAEALLEVAATAPANPVQGQLYYDTTEKAKKLFDGTEWVYLSPIQSATAPTGVAENTLWLDTSQTPPTLSIFDGTDWQGLATGSGGGSGSGGSGSGGSGITPEGTALYQALAQNLSSSYPSELETQMTTMLSSMSGDWGKIKRFDMYATPFSQDHLLDWVSGTTSVANGTYNFLPNEGIRRATEVGINAPTTGVPTYAGVSDEPNGIGFALWLKDAPFDTTNTSTMYIWQTPASQTKVLQAYIVYDQGTISTLQMRTRTGPSIAYSRSNYPPEEWISTSDLKSIAVFSINNTLELFINGELVNSETLSNANETYGSEVQYISPTVTTIAAYMHSEYMNSFEFGNVNTAVVDFLTARGTYS